MTHISKPNPTDDAMDRLLGAHLAGPSEELAPSSGFVASVMDSIHAQAIEPPPIAFPWRRVLPGVIAIVCGLLAFAIFALRQAKSHPHLAPSTIAMPWSHLTLALTLNSREATFCWILLAACLSIAAVAASIRLTGRTE
jgi:hypothetical protein